MKKYVSLLFFCFCVELFAVGGDLGGGNGLLQSPFLIQDFSDFKQFISDPSYWSGYTRLEVDLDLNPTIDGRETYSSAPIASGEFVFEGNFDGVGHKISNLTIDAPGGFNVGLFGYASGAVIKNLVVENCNITGYNGIGALLGRCCCETEILNCSSSGTVTATGSIGTIIGVGGLIGINYEGYVKYSSSFANVNGYEGVGGLCGFNQYGTISNCYSAGAVSGNNYVGGFCGGNSGVIGYSYSTGLVNGNVDTGGFCGISNTAFACFWDVETSGFGTEGQEQDGAVGKTSAQLKSYSTFSQSDWKMYEPESGRPGWYIDSGSYPVLAWEKAGMASVPDVTHISIQDGSRILKGSGFRTGKVISIPSWQIPAGHITGLSISPGGVFKVPLSVDVYVSTGSNGDGSASSPLPIASVKDIEAINTQNDSNYILTADIYYSFDYECNGTIINYLSGSLDGRAHTINNLTINARNLYRVWAGFISRIDQNACVKNLGMENVYIHSINHPDGAGGICGVNAGTIIYCYAKVSIYANSSYAIGGLCGRSEQGGEIRNCYSTGSLRGDQLIGGLVGSCEDTIVSNCYSNCSIEAFDSGMSNGLFGYLDSVVLESSFFDIDASGVAEPIGSYNAIGRPTEEMKSPVTFISAGWREANYKTGMRGWYLPESDYPKLYWENPDACRVPVVSGMEFSQVRESLRNNSLVLGNVYNVNSRTVEAGKAVGISASADGFADKSLPIDIYVSTGSVGDGSPESPWRVACMADLNGIQNGSYVLVRDIYAGYDVDRRESVIETFEGYLDGDGHVIYNLLIDGSYDNVSNLAFIGVCSFSSKITRLGLEEVSVFAGHSTIRLGALCALSQRAAITECYSTGQIGEKTTPFIQGASIAGGLCGENNFGVISGCYSTCKVLSLGEAGGLCGYSFGGVISNCYSAGFVEASYDSYDIKTAGLCGYQYHDNAVIENSFWDTQGATAGYNLSESNYGSVNYVYGLSTSQMQDGSYFTAAGWDFDAGDDDGAEWFMPEDSSPRLYWQNRPRFSGRTSMTLKRENDADCEYAYIDVYAPYEGRSRGWTISGFKNIGVIESVIPSIGSSSGPDDKAKVQIAVCPTMSEGDHFYTLTMTDDEGADIPIPLMLHVYQDSDVPVGMGRLSKLGGNWLEKGCYGGTICSETDWFEDGNIDIFDLFQLADSWLYDSVATASFEIWEDFESGSFSLPGWNFTGDSDWGLTMNGAYNDSNYSAKAGNIENGQASSISLTADTAGCDKIRFACKVSSEQWFDYLVFYIDGSMVDFYSGYDLDWMVYEYDISGGTKTFEWKYLKDALYSEGGDSAWIDDIRIYNSEH